MPSMETSEAHSQKSHLGIFNTKPKTDCWFALDGRGHTKDEKTVLLPQNVDEREAGRELSGILNVRRHAAPLRCCCKCLAIGVMPRLTEGTQRVCGQTSDIS